MKNRKGEENINKHGTLMKIIQYKDANNIVVEFQDEHKFQVKTSYHNFKQGTVSNNFDKRVYGVGCIGNTKIGEYGRDEKISYKMWYSMMTRCYSKNKKESYKDCSVCDEWLCYSNFEKWFNNNYYEVENEKMTLDKDILCHNLKLKNKIYSPETCLILPIKLNNLFIYQDRKKKDGLPTGIGVNKNSDKYYYEITMGNKRVKRGGFNTMEESFEEYKKIKENYINEVLMNYKYRIPKSVYEGIKDYRIKY